MGVPRNDQVMPVSRHRIEYAAIRGMRDTDREIDLVTINRPGDIGIAILINMGVVGPAEADPDTLDLQRGTGVSQIDPARLL